MIIGLLALSAQSTTLESQRHHRQQDFTHQPAMATVNAEANEADSKKADTNGAAKILDNLR